VSAAGNHTLQVTVRDELANKSLDVEEPILVQQ
jgi:hypothetical protein